MESCTILKYMTENTFSITENAAKRIAYLAGQEPVPQAKLRIAVDGGGCSGFQYRYEFTNEKAADDHLFERDGAAVLVDEMSLGFLNGSVVDYVETLGAAHFEIKNPNASANCGCGNSFAV